MGGEAGGNGNAERVVEEAGWVVPAVRAYMEEDRVGKGRQRERGRGGKGGPHWRGVRGDARQGGRWGQGLRWKRPWGQHELVVGVGSGGSTTGAGQTMTTGVYIQIC